MRKAYLLLLFCINLMLSACSEESPDNSYPVNFDYSISVRLADLTGNNLTKELPLEFLSEDAVGLKMYAIKEGDFHFYFDGKEMVSQQGDEPTVMIGRYVYEPPSSSASPFICLFFVNTLVDIQEFKPGLQPTHTFEYRFTLPSMFGEEEQVISIQCAVRNFLSTESKKVFINGVESESNRTNSFVFIVDKD